MKKIVVITPDEAEYGFKLTGVTHYVTCKEDAESLLRSSIGELDTGLIILDERLLKGIPAEQMKEITDRWSGIVLILPPPERPGAEIEDYAARLIRQAIGYHVRLKV
jgi:V/A-type H+-transporting ATPase subunit F